MAPYHSAHWEADCKQLRTTVNSSKRGSTRRVCGRAPLPEKEYDTIATVITHTRSWHGTFVSFAMLDTFQNAERQHLRRKERERYMQAIHAPPATDRDHLSTSIFESLATCHSADLIPIVDVLSGEPLKTQVEDVKDRKQAYAFNRYLRRKSLCCVGVPLLIVFIVVVLLVSGVTNKNQVPDSVNPRKSKLFSLIVDMGVSSDRLNDGETPASHALDWLVTDSVDLKDYEAVRTRFALATLYFSTTSKKPWNSAQYWLSEYPVCLWEGVTCIHPDHDDRQQVKALELDHHGREGYLPEELSLLQRDLHVLDLSNNHLQGSIPNLDGLSNLERLYLGPNNLTSTIPDSLYSLKHLDHLYLNQCELSGSISTKIGQLSALQGLGLQNNFLTGVLPTELGLLIDLRALYIDSNQLKGSLPTELTAVTKIIDLRLSNNHFVGELPINFAQLQYLEVFYASANKLTGPLPSLGNLVRDIQLFDNEFGGTLPASWCQKGLLWHLYLDGNILSGSLPQDWTSPFLESLYLFGNDFVGELPQALGDLKRLQHLRLQSNRFEGKIPSSFGQLGELRDLDLSNNLLTGKIPSQLASLVSLVSVNVKNNYLTGTTPWLPDGPNSTCSIQLVADCAEVGCQCCSGCL